MLTKPNSLSGVVTISKYMDRNAQGDVYRKRGYQLFGKNKTLLETQKWGK